MKKVNKFLIDVEIPVYKNGIEIGVKLRENIILKEIIDVGQNPDVDTLFTQPSYKSTLGKHAQKSRLQDNARKMYDKELDKSFASDENNGLIQAFTELISLGYNRTFENFKIHHVSNQNHLIDKEIAKTKKFLAKKTKCTI